VEAALVLQDNVESFHHLRYKVSTLFLDVKWGFDNLESPSLLSLLCRKEGSLYLVQWVGSFLRDRTCRLTFQGSPCLFAPYLVGVPQGSPHLPPTVCDIRLLPPPGKCQITYYLLHRRFCCHRGLALLQNQCSSTSETLLIA